MIHSTNPHLYSEAHRRILEMLAQFEREGLPAFVPDLVKRLGLAAESSLGPTLRLMERDGLLEIRGGGVKGRSRLVVLKAEARFGLGLGGLPVLGQIPAGPLQEALSEPEMVLGESEFLAYRPGDFLLRVRGDSMVGDGILDGDLVLLRPEVQCESGEIAAVQTNDTAEATLKRVIFNRKNNSIILRASNPRYEDIVKKSEDVRVAGVYRGLIRNERVR